jgi:adenylosuccinate synthase
MEMYFLNLKFKACVFIILQIIYVMATSSVNPKNIDIVVGLQYGDEGKGKIVKHLIEKNNYGWCVRFNGGPNAGHTIYMDGKKLVTHQIPTGIVRPGVKCWISSGCVVDIGKLNDEIDALESAGVHNIAERLFISPACHVITKEMINYDITNNSVGTTGSGIGPTYAAKAYRTGNRVSDIIKIGNFNGQPLRFNLLEMIPPEEVSSSEILLEGAQGFHLDIDWGKYPFVTSCNCIAPYAFVSTGLPMKAVRDIIGIAKIYETYVGSNQFQGCDPELITLQEIGQEFGSTTGRRRQTNWLNIANLMKAIETNRSTQIIFNKCDILQKLDKFKMYDEDGSTLVEFTTLELMMQRINEILTRYHPDLEIFYSGSATKL